MLELFHNFYDNVLIKFYELKFKKIPYSQEISGYFPSDKEAMDVYKQIRYDRNFNFPFDYVAHFDKRYKQIVYNSDIACEYSLSLQNGISKDAIFEVLTINALSNWLFFCLPDKNDNVLNYDISKCTNIEKENVHIVISQLLTKIAIANDKDLLKAFYALNKKQKDVYNLFEFLENRTIEDLANDIIKLRKEKEYSLAKWSDIIGVDDIVHLIENGNTANTTLIKTFLSKNMLQNKTIRSSFDLKDFGIFD